MARPMMSNNTPNLDAMTHTELVEFVETCGKLESYARALMLARVQRAHGYIQEAMKLERECDRIYKTLPGPARW
jgi:uncharacterized protein Yka (UPF0111/DUF47 family)